jgi:hypothetical protein
MLTPAMWHATWPLIYGGLQWFSPPLAAEDAGTEASFTLSEQVAVQNQRSPSTATPAYPAYRIFADESGTNARLPCYGFGLLWIPNERRGTFHADVRRLKERHGKPLNHEIKWTKTTPANLPLYKAAVDYVLQAPNVFFHAIIYPRRLVDLTYHEGSWDLARRKHFVAFLRDRIKRFSRGSGASTREFHVRVDAGYSEYAKATEAAHKILNAGLANDSKIRNVVTSFREVDSAETQGVQLCDLILGAVMAARQEEITASAKLELLKHLADRLGWPDLKCFTYPQEPRFNIWCWHPADKDQLSELRPRAITSRFISQRVYTGLTSEA